MQILLLQYCQGHFLRERLLERYRRTKKLKNGFRNAFDPRAQLRQKGMYLQTIVINKQKQQKQIMKVKAR